MFTSLNLLDISHYRTLLTTTLQSESIGAYPKNHRPISRYNGEYVIKELYIMYFVISITVLSLRKIR